MFRTTATGAPTTDWYLARKISAWRGPDPGGFWQTVYPDKPASLILPDTLGTPVPTYELSLNNYFIWDYSGYRAPTTVTYQWQRSLNNVTYTDISGQTGLTYIVQEAEIGYFIRCRIRGTNARDFTDVFSDPTERVPNPNYTFNFGTSFGVNANAFITFDPVNNVFPTYGWLDSIPGRALRYFLGNYRHFRTWYKSDTTTFRLFVELYREDRGSTPPATRDIAYEIVFTAGSNVVDIYVVDPVDTGYIIDYTAWEVNGYLLKQHPSASYLTGRRFRVTMNASTAVSVATASASTTAPSILTGWIQLDNFRGSSIGTITFNESAGTASPILPNVNGAFTKQNMFFPTTPTVADPVYATTTTATVSWSGSNANGYYVTATRTDDSSNTVVYSSFFGSATTSTTLTGLVSGATYTVSVSPISRGAPSYDGQFGSAGVKSYSHVTAPSAVQNLTATSPTQATPSAGDSGESITYTVSWSAPVTGAPITRYEYDLDIDAAETGLGTFDGVYTSNGTSTSLSIGPFSGLQLDIRVRAVNAAGAGPYTEIRLNSSPSVPGTPSAAAVVSTNAQTSINWTASNARGGSDLTYTVYRGQNSTTIASKRNNTPQSLTSFSDNVYGGGVTYYYRVVPQNKLNTDVTAIGLRSAASNVVNVTQPTVNVLPVVSANSVSVLVIFSGNIGSGSTPNYSVFRGQNTNPQTSVGTATGGSTNSGNNLLAVTDNGNFSFSTTYYYKVQMTNNINQVEAIASVTTPSGAAPGRPGAPSGSANNQFNNVNLSWGASADNGGGTVTYTVYRGQNSANVTNPVGTSTNTQFQDSYSTNPGSGNWFYRVVPSTPWGGTGQQSNVSAGIPAS